VNPLAVYNAEWLTAPQPVQFYESLRTWAREPISGTYLSDRELDELVAFLRTLEYESDAPVHETD